MSFKKDFVFVNIGVHGPSNENFLELVQIVVTLCQEIIETVSRWG